MSEGKFAKAGAVLSALEEETMRIARHHGAGEKAAAIAFDVVDWFRQHHGGIEIFIAKGLQFEISERDAIIYREFRGNNVGALARKYGLTERQIYSIVAKCRSRWVEENQPSLFGEAV